jgi:hypothetical protein
MNAWTGIHKGAKLLFITILLLGIFARVWDFGQVPPGLNQDEASIGVEAFDLYHFGVDRNGIAYPVNFVSWGSGMDALYGYVLIPFIAFGLNPITVRLPSLLSGILTLPLVYFVALRTFSQKTALISMFLLAISPWNIILSRWGINENILPFVFLIGYSCLLLSTADNHWFLISSIFFALCFYAYAVTFVALPIFLGGAVLTLVAAKRVSIRTLAWGLLVLAIMVVPLVIFVLINTIHLDTIRLGLITIPRLPSQARYQTMAAVFDENPIQSVFDNFLIMLNLLVGQSDGLIWNTVEPYGYFYKITFPLAVFGAISLFGSRNSDRTPERQLLVYWLFAALSIGLVISVNINRFGLVFIPLLLCISTLLVELGNRHRYVTIAALCALLIGFIAFTRDYHGGNYRREADKQFFSGLIPAFDFAHQASGSPICVTDTVNMPYIFALFSEGTNPADYLDDVEYKDPAAAFREVRSLGRYRFGMDECPTDPKTIYILSGEPPPENGIDYKVTTFDTFKVYVP